MKTIYKASIQDMMAFLGSWFGDGSSDESAFRIASAYMSINNFCSLGTVDHSNKALYFTEAGEVCEDTGPIVVEVNYGVPASKVAKPASVKQDTQPREANGRFACKTANKPTAKGLLRVRPIKCQPTRKPCSGGGCRTR